MDFFFSFREGGDLWVVICANFSLVIRPVDIVDCLGIAFLALVWAGVLGYLFFVYIY